jgi:formamidopyrimidine-DNA glycosylase
MPEGPECHHYADQLNRLVAGQRIFSVTPVSGRYMKTPIEGLSHFNFRSKLGSVGVKGKFLYFEFTKEENGLVVPQTYIWNTLGLSGGWFDAPHPHARVKFEFENQILWFCDQRNFGTIKMSMSLKETADKLETLGIDFLLDDFDLEYTLEIFEKRSVKTKTMAEVLMCQENYAGIGNYLKAEILYASKISPWRNASSLTLNELKLLHCNVRDIIRAAYAAKDKNKLPWFYTECGQDYKKIIYGQEKDPLGNEIINEVTKDGRTTWWVPSVQK